MLQPFLVDRPHPPCSSWKKMCRTVPPDLCTCFQKMLYSVRQKKGLARAGTFACFMHSSFIQGGSHAYAAALSDLAVYKACRAVPCGCGSGTHVVALLKCSFDSLSAMASWLRATIIRKTRILDSKRRLQPMKKKKIVGQVF